MQGPFFIFESDFTNLDRLTLKSKPFPFGLPIRNHARNKENQDHSPMWY